LNTVVGDGKVVNQIGHTVEHSAFVVEQASRSGSVVVVVVATVVVGERVSCG